MTTEAIFGSPYPGYMAHGFDRATGQEYRIIFAAGEYTTSDPDEIAFLQGIAADERGRAVFVKRLPVHIHMRSGVSRNAGHTGRMERNHANCRSV